MLRDARGVRCGAVRANVLTYRDVLAVAEHAGDVAEGAAVGDLDPVTSFFFTVQGYPVKGS